ncbi:Kelch repeat-containing protein [Planctobacterium marinum]|uniref:Galactose oxidase n=1 Tax=Planctobacterium marinum TaxID=1631968 RepID=A0AA48I0Y3_9ALTE|nr:hypothetical protein MACH26_37510 [Planctobacterium marinum]
MTVDTESGSWFITFMGLAEGKDWQDVHNKVWALKSGDTRWQEKTPVPATLPLKGRLASIAVALNGKAWLFGGYTVAEDHSEISSPDNYSYDVLTDNYTKLKDMPVPVDDAVAVTYQNRYIYLISGWHNDGNVNLVQIYDTKTDSWQQGSPYPGAPVFGHAGGILDDQILVCDGVKVVPQRAKRRTFAPESACYKGIINPSHINKIDWQIVAHPTGKSRYRMAAKGVKTPSLEGVLFIGGSDNPYNYNGVGYNGEPSEPDEMIWFYHFDEKRWQLLANDDPTMDHRGLLEYEAGFYIIAGMGKNQQVLNRITHFNKQQLLTTISENKNNLGQE